MDKWRIWLARVAGLGCIALGIIGLVAGFTDNTWELSPIGWFTGGSLLGVVALILLLDDYVESRRNS